MTYGRRTFNPVRVWVVLGCALAAAVAMGMLGADRSGGGPSSGARPGKPVAQRAQSAYGKLPLRFEANRGQTDGRVRFLARGAGYGLFLTSGEAVLSLSRSGTSRSARTSPPTAKRPPSRSAVVRTRLLGANPHPSIEGLDRLPGVSNYLTARGGRGSHTNVPGYGRVRYRGVYPGVDLIYYGRQGRLEYDFRVAPGSDAGAIRLGVRGAGNLSVDQSGDLVMSTTAGTLRQLAPVAYQRIGSRRHRVRARYTIEGHRAGFSLGRYDHTRALVIDPALTYSTYLGGATGGSAVSVVAADSSGAAYVAGDTSAVDFPTTSGAFQKKRGKTSCSEGDRCAFLTDAFVTKINPGGNALVYSTYLGGGDDDGASAIAVDSSGRAYVTGNTASSDFPATPDALTRTLPNGCDPYQCSAFLSVLKANGSGLDYSTYLGGAGSNRAGGVAVDSSGHAYVTGFTSASASDFPVKAPAPATPLQPAPGGNGDAFVAKLDPARSGSSSLVYSTFLGGTDFDDASAIAVDASGNAYVAGSTNSTDFPTKSPFQVKPGGAQDAFVAKLNSSGSALSYSTYLGGGSFDFPNAIALDPSDHAYVIGNTGSTDFPTANAFQPKHAGDPADFTSDAFVSKLAPDGRSLAYSSYLGGPGNDSGAGIAVTPSGTAYVGGSADTSVASVAGRFPTLDPLAPAAIGGDAFVAAVRPDGSGLSFSSNLGGGSEDNVGGNLTHGGVALDPAGNVYVAGNAVSTDFPTHNAIQDQNLGRGVGDRREAFVAKLAPVAAAAPLVTGLGRRSGPAGTSLVITGHGLSGASAVSFGSVAASSFTVNSEEQITASAPNGPSGPVAVTVTTPQGTSPPNPIAMFTYAPGTWDLTGSLREKRFNGETATLLSNGKVLVAGGLGPSYGPTRSAELYDPSTGGWTATGPMVVGRSGHTATLLSDGTVLVAGGCCDPVTGQQLTSAELYDPTSRTWTATRSMTLGRSEHTATLLSTGRVLVAGGFGSNSTPTRLAELYDSATQTWSPAGSLRDGRAQHTATLLTNGKVLVAGGGTGNSASVASAELYDPAKNSWVTTGPLGAARRQHTATRLADGRVLVAGGASNVFSLGSAEVYDPATGDFNPTSAMADLRAGPAAALLLDGTVLVTGGSATSSQHNTAELWDPTTSHWASAGVMNHYRGFDFSTQSVFAVRLSNGKVLVGGDSESPGATTELYTPAGPGPSSPGPGSSPAGLTSSGTTAGNGKPDTTPPVVSGIGLTNNPFVVGGRTPTFGITARARQHKRGTTVRYTLSEAATVRIVIARGRSGRRKGKRCVAPTRSLRHARKCIRLVVKGTLTRTSHKGTNRVAFSGRIGSKALKPGGYQATLIAIDAARNASKPQTITFRIVKR